MAANSTKAILFALGANTGIAVTKFAAAAYTGSGAMLAEAIHSVADAANQLLLLLGLKRAGAAASEDLATQLPPRTHTQRYPVPVLGN